MSQTGWRCSGRETIDLLFYGSRGVEQKALTAENLEIPGELRRVDDATGFDDGRRRCLHSVERLRDQRWTLTISTSIRWPSLRGVGSSRAILTRSTRVSTGRAVSSGRRCLPDDGVGDLFDLAAPGQARESLRRRS